MRRAGVAIVVMAAGCDLVFPPGRLDVDPDAPTIDAGPGDPDGMPDATVPSTCLTGPFDVRRYAQTWNLEPGMLWSRGRDLCTQRGWELITIDDGTEAMDVGALFTISQYWVGLTDDDNDNTWTSLHGCPDPQAWDTGQPENGTEHCAGLVGTVLHDFPCDVSGAIDNMLCEQPRPPTQACIDDANKLPPITAYTPGAAMTYANAEGFCGAFGAHLVVLDTPDEHAAVAAAFPGEFWIGATDAGVEGTWASPTDCPGYLPWAFNEPNDTADVEDCALLMTTVGLNDTDCNDMRFALCETQM